MPLVGTTEMFKKAYQGHYAIGAFNVNNMEIIQGIMEAAKEEESPVILQASEGARNYAGQEYIVGLVKTALQDYPEIPTALHLDHGSSYEICKACIDGGLVPDKPSAEMAPKDWQTLFGASDEAIGYTAS